MISNLTRGIRVQKDGEQRVLDAIEWASVVKETMDGFVVLWKQVPAAANSFQAPNSNAANPCPYQCCHLVFQRRRVCGMKMQLIQERVFVK